MRRTTSVMDIDSQLEHINKSVAFSFGALKERITISRGLKTTEKGAREQRARIGPKKLACTRTKLNRVIYLTL